jgi:threonine aldolase
MGNLVGVLTHAGRGDEIIVGRDNHVLLWEAGSIAALGGIFPHVLPTDRYGRLDLDEVATAVSDKFNDHLPHTRLIHVENSYGAKGGYPLPPAYFAEIRKIADKHNLAVHMDGARLFNAAAALNIDARELTQHVDSVTFCLSKGLCAPVGSVICGSSDFIQRARRTRKALGGGMRQAGILAAAGIVALNEMVERLADDHAHARIIANSLAEMPGVTIAKESVCTNMLFFELTNEATCSPQELVSQLRQRANIWIGGYDSTGFRVVTHYWIGLPEVELFTKTMHDILS